MTTANAELSYARYWRPRYWPVWIALAALHASARLPLAPQIAIAERLGRALGRLRKRATAIAARNLEICFPELSPAERAALLDRHFEALGASPVELAFAWFGSRAELRRRLHIEGLEHLEAAVRQGRGVILLAGHFTTIDIAFALLEEHCPSCGCMYSPVRNPMLDVMLRRGRSRFLDAQIRDDDVWGLVRYLRRGGVVAYLPDQTYLGSHSALLPFFGEPAMTNTATSKLARITGAVVLPYRFQRLAGQVRYRVRIGAPLEDFPSGDTLADTRRLVALLEEAIREAPEQYLWTYRKFKGRPAPYPDLYRR